MLFNELGYYEHSAETSTFFLERVISHFWLTSMFKKSVKKSAAYSERILPPANEVAER